VIRFTKKINCFFATVQKQNCASEREPGTVTPAGGRERRSSKADRTGGGRRREEKQQSRPHRRAAVKQKDGVIWSLIV